MSRLAIILPDRCKPKKCKQECVRACPVVMLGKLCIEVTPADKLAYISEELCIGCNACVKKCPFDAIKIINLPTASLPGVVHRFSGNSFKLHHLPIPRLGSVVGLVGANGMGKSTIFKILGGKIIPNFGDYSTPTAPTAPAAVASHFGGSELQGFFSKNLASRIKPQYIDVLYKTPMRDSTVRSLIDPTATIVVAQVCSELQLGHLLDRTIAELSGGELQRFCIAYLATQTVDVYMFDEPSSFLDIKQRIAAGRVIRGCARDDTFTLVVEHDLALLDYLSDYICVLYGEPGAYGVVSAPMSVRDGINIFLDGYLPTENLRFRDTPLIFVKQDGGDADVEIKQIVGIKYPAFTYTVSTFNLQITAGQFNKHEITVLLGENGTGKTTMVRLLAGVIESTLKLDSNRVSYKPQLIKPTFTGTVSQLFDSRGSKIAWTPQYMSTVVKPLQIEALLNNKVQDLSGGELQRVAIVLCLSKSAEIYLIDEPSAYLDSEQRLAVAKAIKQFTIANGKIVLVVEHDFMMAMYMANNVIVFSGQPGIQCTASSPQPLESGLNDFLASMQITIRRDPVNQRPRINKLNSQLDKEQKTAGNYAGN